MVGYSKGENVLVQEYIDDVMLYHNKKVDFRVFLLVVNMFDTVTAYIFNDGWGNLAAEDY